VALVAGGGFDEARVEQGRGEHDSATLEVRGSGASHSASATDVAVSSAHAAVNVPFASSEDDRNLQTTVSTTLL